MTIQGTVWFQEELRVETGGRGTYDITHDVAALVSQSKVRTGLCHIFIRHTSASLIISENADAEVHRDLERFMTRLAPDGHPDYRHNSEGPDDMAAHIRSCLTEVTLQVPIAKHALALGIWQSLYLWEHRLRPHSRLVVVTVTGVG